MLSIRSDKYFTIDFSLTRQNYKKIIPSWICKEYRERHQSEPKSYYSFCHGWKTRIQNKVEIVFLFIFLGRPVVDPIIDEIPEKLYRRFSSYRGFNQL